ncbi:MAG: IS1595 family transposase [Reyranella sp.]|uniref:IS1595 family transposase n=1 Tax=Reyranella sp. TaxID=1929291 RepID=UPI0025ED908C|nr:IS1595 family transposase [Reyranella sp.]MBR2818804.1 IS1595 family transposase [Reyranella sp.]
MTAKNPLNNVIFQDASKARAWLEALLWAGGRACGYCGTLEASSPLKGRDGYYQCKACRKQFTVMVGTVFERSHIPLNKWLQAAFIMSASKKGMSAHQMSRMLGVTYKSTWFMCHRLREAMKTGSLPPLGGEGMVVEADETYLGNLPAHKAPVRKTPGRPKFGPHHKRAIVSLVERGGQARSFYAETAKVEKVAAIVRENVAKESRLHTDTSSVYKHVGKEFASHEKVNHFEKEFARGDVTTNTIEGFFSIFKRGMKGVYQHCDERHLHRYLAEFDFRYNNRTALGVDDGERTTNMLKGISGKRPNYRRINERATA